MDINLLEDIYANVKNNIIRYWTRTWLIHKLYHDAELCDAINDSDNNIIHSYTHIREALVDSSVVCLYRGVFDLGNDSLSLTRLIPSSSNFLSDNKPGRLEEENESYALLKDKWYDGNPPDDIFDGNWEEIIEIVRDLRQTDKVQRILSMRNKMVAHSLDRALNEPPEFSMIHELREDLIPIMNKLTGMFEENYTEWELYVSDCERISLGYRRLLNAGLEQLNN